MATATIEFSEDQQEAIDAILEWREASNSNGASYMTLGGYAGCGKTTVVAHLVERWHTVSHRVAVAALAGKAAHVLRSKGVPAQTIHSLIYERYTGDDGKVKFRKRESIDPYGTVIIDEASMVNEEIFSDLMSFNKPILFVGDHGQLEPIGPNPRLMDAPDVRLEKIHRQAANNPIIRLATAFREGRSVPNWRDPQGRLEIVNGGFMERLSPNVQAICGYNKTRHAANAKIRAMLKFDGERICRGERLIVLKNNREFDVFNGQQLTVTKLYDVRTESAELQCETDDGRRVVLPILLDQLGRDLDKHTHFYNQWIYADYGYCLTTHKSQGSEWKEVLVKDEAFGKEINRWRYTAATRASEKIVWCR